MFHRIISLMIFVGFSSIGLDLQAQRGALADRRLTRHKSKAAGISLNDPRGMFVGQAAFEKLALDAYEGVAPVRALTPGEKGTLSRMMARKGRIQALKQEERAAAEMLLQFDSASIIQALQSAHDVGALKVTLKKNIDFIDRITFRRSGDLVAKFYEVRGVFQSILDALQCFPEESHIQLHDGDNDYDHAYEDGGHCGEVVAPSYKERLVEFIQANRKVGYKLLVVSVLVGGTWGFAPLYLPLVLTSAAVSGGFSGVAQYIRTGSDVATAMADGAMKGALVSVMPTSGLVTNGLAGAAMGGLVALTDEKDKKKIVQEAAVGAVFCVGSYLALDSLSGLKVPEAVTGRALVALDKPVEMCPVQPTCPRVEAPFDPRMLHPRRLPESVVTSVSNGPRGLVPVSHDPRMIICSPDARTCLVPAYAGASALPVFVVPTTPADLVLDGLRQRVIELERIVDAQNVSIREAIKPVARKIYDGIKLTSLFDQLLSRDMVVHVQTTKCGIDAASIEQLQQCVVNLERTIVDHGRLVEEALKPMAKKAYSWFGLTTVMDYVFSRFPSSGTAGVCTGATNVSTCVSELERTVAARDALIAESLKPMARKFYDAVGLTKLVAAVRG